AGRLIVGARDQHGDYVAAKAELRDTDGQKVPVWFLSIMETDDGVLIGNESNDHGFFAHPSPLMDPLPPRDYELVMSAEGFATRSVEFTIEPGKTTELDVPLAGD